MLGFDLDWWNAAMLVSLGAAALAAIALLLSNKAVVVLQDREAKDNAAAFVRYQMEAGKKIAEANSAAELARADAAKANERAAGLEMEAARITKENILLQIDLRNKGEVIKRIDRKLGDRDLSDDGVSRLISLVRGKIASLTLIKVDDWEAGWLADSFAKAFRLAGVGVSVVPADKSKKPFFGIIVCAEDKALGTLLLDAMLGAMTGGGGGALASKDDELCHMPLSLLVGTRPPYIQEEPVTPFANRPWPAPPK